ncbi:MAG: efflux RND transporter periplasmic adaptor subunit [Muribaculaceae bacterium]|nr:efflux RND transporter periplasmic adaptor subunit [Muribaculaceae bacterium]
MTIYNKYNKDNAGSNRKDSSVLEDYQRCRRMKQFNRAMRYGLFLSCGCVIMCMLFAGCKKKSDHQQEDAPKEIEVALPIVDSVDVYADFPANLVSLSQADVVARVNGNILKRHFTEGSYVTKGQLLYTIESTNYTSGVSQARAQLESARSQLDYATKHYNALTEAFAMDAVSQMEVEQGHSSKIQAEAAVRSAQAALEAQNVKLGYCNVYAPISGKISASTLDAGNYVAGEGSPVKLATIYDDNNLTVNFSVPEYQYSEIGRQPAGFNSPVYQNFPVVISSSPDVEDNSTIYHASLIYQAPSVDPSSGVVALKARINDAGDELRAGMYGKVKFPIATVSDGILVREASISTDQRGKYLYTLNDSNRIVYTPIETGELYHDSLRLVKSGISPKTRYVTRAMMSVRNGELVRPVVIKNN